MRYGYYSVMTPEADEAALQAQLRAAGAAEISVDRLLLEGETVRAQLANLLAKLQGGDEVVVPSLSQLADSFSQAADIWRQGEKAGANWVVLDLPKDVPFDRLLLYMGTLSRQFTRQMQLRTMARARAEGRRWGPVPMEKPDIYEEVLDAWKKGKLSTRKAAAQLNVSAGTFTNWARADGASQDESEDSRLTDLADRYPHGLSDEAWAAAEASLEAENTRSRRRRKTGNRELLDAIIWKFGNRCPWNDIPDTIGNWWSIYSCYVTWKGTGALMRMIEAVERVEETSSSTADPDASGAV